jgi:hypothetical protein
MTTTTSNFENLKWIDGDFTGSTDFGDSIYANEGSFSEKSQSMTFYYNGEEVMVNYDLDVTAHIMEDAGDYWNPSASEAVVDGIEVNITEVFVGDDLVSLIKFLCQNLKELLKITYNKYNMDIKKVKLFVRLIDGGNNLYQYVFEEILKNKGEKSISQH